MAELELCIPEVDRKRLCLPACSDRAATRATERLNIVKRLKGMDSISGDRIGNWRAGGGQLLGWDKVRKVCWKERFQRTVGA